MAFALLAARPLVVSASPVLERVVLVERHGVRAPTQANGALDALSSSPWPVWSVPPGGLTTHGAQGVELMAEALRLIYASKGAAPSSGCPAPDSVAVIADGADERTRDSARAFAKAFAPGCAIPVRDTAETDPLFDALAVNPLDPAAADAAVKAASGGAIDTPASRSALLALQAIVAPQGCETHTGVCLNGDSTALAAQTGVKIKGPLGIGATLAENLFLEYAEGLPPDQVGWGRVHGAADIAAVIPAHERVVELTRKPAYIAAHRSAVLVQAIRNALQGRPGAYGDGRARFTLFLGHDTNLSNLAGALGLSWSLEDQPDQTAPVTTLAFELWRDDKTGETSVKARVFYETLDQLRTLAPAAVRQTEAVVAPHAAFPAELAPQP